MYFMSILRTSQNKGANAGDESGQKRVEWKRANEQTVEKLHYSSQHDVGEVCIYQLQPLRGSGRVLVEESPNNGQQIV